VVSRLIIIAGHRYLASGDSLQADTRQKNLLPMTSQKDLAELRERFAGFTATVHKNLPFIKNEADVCNFLIDPLLGKIDWSPFEAARVVKEFKITLPQGRADYALLGKPANPAIGQLGNPLVIIEAKHKNALPKDHIPPV